MTLKYKVKEITMSLAEARERQRKDVSLSAYLAANFKDEDGKPLTVDGFYRELGINPDVVTLTSLQSMDGDQKWLIPEIVLDALKKGFRRAPFYAGLVARSLPISGPVAIQPYIEDDSNAGPVESGEGATPKTTTVTFSNKQVTLTKKERAIVLTDEVMQYCSLAVLALHLEQLGSRWGASQDAALITAAINGDQADLSNNAAQIGVTDTDDGLTWDDLIRCAVRGALLGRQYRALICGEAELRHLLGLDEFKVKVVGQPLVGANVFGIKLPDTWNFYCHGSVPSDLHVILDPDSALVELVSSPMQVESERMVMRGLNGSVARITNGFSVLQRDARVVVDDGEEYDEGGGHNFPSWMTPITG